MWAEQVRGTQTLFLGTKIKSEGKWLSVVLNLCGMHEQGQHTVSFRVIWNGFIRLIQDSSAGVYDTFLRVFGSSSFKFLCYNAIKAKIQTKNALLFPGVEWKLFLCAKEDETDRKSSKHAKYGHVCSPENTHASLYSYLCEDLHRHFLLCSLHTGVWPFSCFPLKNAQ